MFSPAQALLMFFKLEHQLLRLAFSFRRPRAGADAPLFHIEIDDENIVRGIWLRKTALFENEFSLAATRSGMPDPYGLVHDVSRRGEACLAQRFIDFFSTRTLTRAA